MWEVSLRSKIFYGLVPGSLSTVKKRKEDSVKEEYLGQLSNAKKFFYAAWLVAGVAWKLCPSKVALSNEPAYTIGMLASEIAAGLASLNLYHATREFCMGVERDFALINGTPAWHIRNSPMPDLKTKKNQ